jgi:hypothetical protein
MKRLGEVLFAAADVGDRRLAVRLGVAVTAVFLAIPPLAGFPRSMAQVDRDCGKTREMMGGRWAVFPARQLDAG